ncbi:aarF domain-containing kinase [Fistulifera solaris]|jgi:aarF domain-containing kinase|uniref:AarF domain-containing kinase n=1 Tax=Fistulifera solaris TaxID=1519565 RepID=A0A1Z5K2R3_FISSO|nr:aarF domain-containing kinase [Fistulifera solaris]|eukprot:GAX20515.1 aarF domain-containing kinase [Fistulifera solaris]
MSSWLRVLTGARKVAQAACQQTDWNATAIRTAQHGRQIMDSLQKQYETMSINSNATGMSDDRLQTETIKPINANKPSSTPSPSSTSTASKASTEVLQPEIASTSSTASNELTQPPLESSKRISASPGTAATTQLPDKPLKDFSQGSAVPSSRFGRAFGFARLGAGLVWGTATEGLNRLVSGQSKGSSVVVNDANAHRLAATLCRMRGAALKLGQMLSIQDQSLLPEALSRALEQVRQGAEAMPQYQLEQQMQQQLGADWRQRFRTFDDHPMAAASIGQVHKATLPDGRTVVVKVQYPGVAESIESDLRNLTMLINLSGLAPKGLFIDKVLSVGQAELSLECDYVREAEHQVRVQQLVNEDPVLSTLHRFQVPAVIPELSTERVLTTEFCPGSTIDVVAHLSQEERNRIAKTILYLTFKEILVWRLMQTDPNWGNFLYDVGTQTTSLIDFGATREYSKEFMDGYLRMVWASANRDAPTLLEQSRRMKFLTGDENETMIDAHIMSGYTVGEPFWSDEPFDFRGSNISSRLSGHMAVFMKHRLTAPPEEVYTLHRKIAGAFMLCIKLNAKIQCRDILYDIVKDYAFEDGLDRPVLEPSA